MYDITKTRMLLTTAVFAAVAALSASGANARIPADTSSASAVQESLRTGRSTRPRRRAGGARAARARRPGARRTPSSRHVSR